MAVWYAGSLRTRMTSPTSHGGEVVMGSSDHFTDSDLWVSFSKM